MSDLGRDLRYGLRGLRRSPGFTLVAVLTLALGIGANSVIYSLVDAILLRPVPAVREPERLVEIVPGELSYPTFRDLQSSPAPLEGLAGFRSRRLAVQLADRTQTQDVGLVSGNYFRLLGARVTAGRLLGEGDDSPGAAPVAVVSERFWRGAMGSDPGAVGRTIHVSGSPVTVVGVAGARFRGTRLVRPPQIWVTMASWPIVRPSGYDELDLSARGWGWLSAIGRLRPGATLAQAQSALRLAGERQRELYPKLVGDLPALQLRPVLSTAAGRDSQGSIVRFMAVLWCVVALVLLIACANIANLLLARAARRRREIALRLAIGASRGRLVRQLVTEAIVLAGCSGVVALAGTWAALHAIRATSLPGGVSFDVIDPAVSGSVLAFTLGIALITAVLFGLAPALQATRDAELGAIRESVAGGTVGGRLRDALLVGQVATSLVLLIGAGLFARGLQHALATDLGFRSDHLAIATVNPGLVHYDGARAERYASAAARRIATLPGVRTAAWTVSVPLTEHNVLSGRAEGQPARMGEQEHFLVDAVGPGYLRTIGTPLVNGREFTEADRLGAPRVAVVNEALARHYWPAQDAIGRRLLIDDTMTVIGVAKDAVVERLGQQATPLVYMPVAQNEHWLLDEIHLVARVEGDPERLLPAIERELRGAAPDVPVYQLSTFGDQLAEVLLPQRLGAALLSAFSLLALAVAAAGMYGVVAYLVSQRTREIGIRMALGARPAAVLGMVLGHSLKRVVLGIAIGLVVAAAITRVAASFLYGVSATDPATYGTTSLLLALVAVAAAYVPALRATRVSPVQALASE